MQKKVWSQGNEQLIIEQYFKDYKGTFLDIGSNDGITLSNTYSLSLIGWNGLCIEPSEAAFLKLALTYFNNENIYCFQLAVSDFNGRADFYNSGSHLNKGDVSLLSTLNKKETERWGNSTVFQKDVADVVSFKTLLKLSPYKEFEFISIDAEGEDLKILKQMDLSALNCKCLCIEYNSNEQTLNEIKDYCSRFGLTNVLLKNAENIILCQK